MLTEKECYALIFSGPQSTEHEGTDETATAMFRLANEQDGFIAIRHSKMGDHAITVSYWETLEAIQRWKDHSNQQVNQSNGQAAWYKNYNVKVAKVLREYHFADESFIQ